MRENVTKHIRTLVDFPTPAKVYLVCSALIGLTVFGGVFSTLQYLYIVRVGFGVDFVGKVSAIANMGFALSCIPASQVGMSFGFKRVIVVGVFLMLVGTVALPMVETLPVSLASLWILSSKVIMQFGFALFMVNSSPFLMRLVPEAKRSLLFSVRAAIWPFSAFVGSVFGGWLPELFAFVYDQNLSEALPFRLSLFVSAALLAPAIPLLLFGMGEVSTGEGDQRIKDDTIPYSLLGAIVVISFLAAPGVAVTRTFFEVYLDGSLAVDPGTIGALSGLGKLLAAGAALLTPVLLKRAGYLMTFTATTLGICTGLVPLAVLPVVEFATVGFAFVSVASAIRMPTFTLFHQSITNPRWRSTVSGATSMAASISYSAIAWGGGYIILLHGYDDLFLLSSLITICSLVPFWYLLGSARG